MSLQSANFILVIWCLFFTQAFAQPTYPHPSSGLQGTRAGGCVINGCGGIYTDNGGLAGNYWNSINDVYQTFCPDSAGQCIQLAFTSFQLESGNPCSDHLSVGSGPTQGSPVIWGPECGTQPPFSVTSFDASGCLTVHFNSGTNTPAAGWEAIISCVPCTGSGPTANINTDCINAEIICDNPPSITANSEGPGLESDACEPGCAISENYSNWYFLYVTQGGSFQMDITPASSFTDYDFAFYGPVTGGCANLGPPARCSYARNTNATGMDNSYPDFSENAITGDGWVHGTNVVTGGIYYLLINQWSYTPGSSFEIDFTGTAEIGLHDAPAIASNSPVCADQTLELFAPNIPGATYHWDGPGANNWDKALQNPTRNPPVAGTYSFYYSINGCTSPTTTIDVIANPIPTPAINPASPNICLGDSITLTASGGNTFLWSTGDTVFSIRIAPTVTTNYSVTVTDSNSCMATISTSVRVDPYLTTTITPSVTTICEKDTAILTAGSAASYFWSDSTTNRSIKVSPDSTTTYSVTVNDTNFCPTTVTATVYVNPNPSISMNSVETICQGDTATLMANGSGKINWSTGDTSKIIMVAPSSSTIYLATLTDTNLCTTSAADTVEVNLPPSVTVSPGDTSICQGNEVTITANGGVAYLWNTSDTTSTILVSPAAQSSYSVTVTDSNACKAVAFSNISVDTIPEAALTASSPDICPGEDVVLTASGGSAYQWSNSGNGTQTTVTPMDTSLYSVTVTNSGGCRDSASIRINVTSTFSVDTTITNVSCYGGTDGAINLMITGGSTPFSFAWSNGMTTHNPTALKAGNYMVTVQDSAGCVEVISANIAEPPKLSINENHKNPCLGGDDGTINIIVNGGVAPYSYLWNDGTAIKDKDSLGNGNYSVTVTDANACWTDTTILLTPADSIYLKTEIINPSCAQNGNDGSVVVQADGSTPPYQYEWSDGSTQSLNNSLYPGNYVLTVIDSIGCEMSDSFNLNYEYNFSISAHGSDTIRFGESTSLSYVLMGSAGIVTNRWSPTESLECYDCPTTVAAPLETTLYTIEVVNQAGCVALDTVIVYVLENEKIEVNTPNIFSPNGDGVNDEFYIANAPDIESFEIRIFDRWGEQVFHSKDQFFRWDGTYKGKLLEADVYIYVIDLTFPEVYKERAKRLKGSVTLVR